MQLCPYSLYVCAWVLGNKKLQKMHLTYLLHLYARSMLEATEIFHHLHFYGANVWFAIQVLLFNQWNRWLERDHHANLLSFLFEFGTWHHWIKQSVILWILHYKYQQNFEEKASTPWVTKMMTSKEKQQNDSTYYVSTRKLQRIIRGKIFDVIIVWYFCNYL